MFQLPAIQSYYDRLAEQYDQSRFGNSYGQYVDAQEKSILKNWLQGIPPAASLELGCGTGRLLGYAETGVDFSKEMLDIAKQKYPARKLHHADIRQTGLPQGAFQAIFSAHVFMHLDKALFPEILSEAWRLLQPGGVFIFDIPSAERRRFLKKNASGWHGNSALNSLEIKALCGDKWRLECTVGVLFLPVHRLPVQLRRLFLPLDSLLCKTGADRWASYRFVRLRKLEL